MEAQNVRFCVQNATPPIMVENVPAHVCVRCGGEVFDDATVEVFERIRDGRASMPKMGIVRVFDFDRARRGQPTVVNGGRATVLLGTNAMTILLGSNAVIIPQSNVPPYAGPPADHLFLDAPGTRPNYAPAATP